MKKIMFNDKFGLTQAVLDGRKTMTRRIACYGRFSEPCVGFEDDNRCYLYNGMVKEAVSHYQVGEVVAIAQSYKDCGFKEKYHCVYGNYATGERASAGWTNKMNVKAELMPHHIRITHIRAERLQDISDYDCLREGIIPDGYFLYTFGKLGDNKSYETPKTAFAALIDKVSGKGTWERNPWVFVYEFEKVD